MSSIALFFSKYVNEKEITKELSSTLKLQVVKDADIISEASNRKLASQIKLEHALYKKTSVFNKFTLERNCNITHLQEIMAEKLTKRQDELYLGLTSLLIPHDITHVLKVLIIDTKEHRIQRAIETGLSEKEATKLIHTGDVKAYNFTDFIFHKEPFDQSLYDIVIPMEDKTPKEVIALIKENFNTTALLETEQSQQAIQDLALTTQVQLALIRHGHHVDVSTKNNIATITVNKSVLNFKGLETELATIASTVQNIRGVDVTKGKTYTTSIYRGQQFTLPPKVLLVDDEKEYVQTLSERLVNRNVGSYAVFDGKEALDLIDSDQPDVMVLDLKMPGISGVEVLKQAKKTNPEIEIIILTGHGSDADRETCMNLGAYAYLQKPTDVEKLSAIINKAHQKAMTAQ